LSGTVAALSPAPVSVLPVFPDIPIISPPKEPPNSPGTPGYWNCHHRKRPRKAQLNFLLPFEIATKNTDPPTDLQRDFLREKVHEPILGLVATRDHPRFLFVCNLQCGTGSQGHRIGRRKPGMNHQGSCRQRHRLPLGYGCSGREQVRCKRAYSPRNTDVHPQ
jgi:hypothetical protein